MAFRSGAALLVLDALISDPAHKVPVKLLGNQLALNAAIATSKLEGRMSRGPEIRDAYHFTQPGEACGPDGDLLAFWRKAVGLRLRERDWQIALGSFMGANYDADLSGWMASGAKLAQSNGPFLACVCVLRAVLEIDDRAERIACMLSDVMLARALNWSAILPVSSQNLTKGILRDLAAGKQGVDLKVQASLLTSIEEAISLSRDLAQRAFALQATAPKLRAKGSSAAVEVFLTEDAVAPSTTLSPLIKGTGVPMTDRAARRFCDRLVELGVAQELTGRSTFRLYGIGP